MLAIIIPTYNEAKNIERLLLQLTKQFSSTKYRIIVVDDSSPDGTSKIALSLKDRLNLPITVITRPKKLGIGSALAQGLGESLKIGADFAITMDGDLSHRISDAFTLWESRDLADVCIGSRYAANGEDELPLHRRTLSLTANRIIKLSLKLPYTDCTSGLRLYRLSCLSNQILSRTRNCSYGFQFELLYLLEKSGARIIEVPIYFNHRNHGSSKLRTSDIFLSLKTLFKLWMEG